jgi:hypothetical protein
MLLAYMNNLLRLEVIRMDKFDEMSQRNLNKKYLELTEEMDNLQLYGYRIFLFGIGRKELNKKITDTFRKMEEVFAQKCINNSKRKMSYKSFMTAYKEEPIEDIVGLRTIINKRIWNDVKPLQEKTTLDELGNRSFESGSLLFSYNKKKNLYTIEITDEEVKWTEWKNGFEKEWRCPYTFIWHATEGLSRSGL